jgi:hypothetical protein
MQPEPWLRGILPGLDPVIEHLIRAIEQIREDTTAALQNLTTDQLWSTAAGFHAAHLAGSTDRLCTYLEGHQLDARQLDDKTGGTPAELIQRIGNALTRYEQIIRQLTPQQYGEIREVGRQRLQTTAISLAIHIAEHGQRHTGQLITTAKQSHR